MFIVVLFIVAIGWLWYTGKLDNVQAILGAAFGVIAGWWDNVLALINGMM
jgi:hypothetical protein